ncbi:hypothetical protein BJX63DRAFT_376001 [Aspergillus granulosus]|uniref:NACHT-NTPase and P-loop NTPases N-terminal domain-containing protein n=1 Tax=Aspergillus granulosus TaxID=176169 RepID=A0ABR4I5E7_9EURO
MAEASLILSIVTPVYETVRKGAREYKGAQDLLAGESKLEEQAGALRALLEEHASMGIPEHLSGAKKDLYTQLVDRCKGIYQEIEEIKQKYQSHLHMGAMRVCLRKLVGRSKLKKLEESLRSVIETVKAYHAVESMLVSYLSFALTAAFSSFV